MPWPVIEAPCFSRLLRRLRAVDEEVHVGGAGIQTQLFSTYSAAFGRMQGDVTCPWRAKHQSGHPSQGRVCFPFPWLCSHPSSAPSVDRLPEIRLFLSSWTSPRFRAGSSQFCLGSASEEPRPSSHSIEIETRSQESFPKAESPPSFAAAPARVGRWARLPFSQDLQSCPAPPGFY